MASIIVGKKWKSCMFVISAYRVHKEPLLDGIARLAQPPPGEEPEGPPSESSGETGDTFFFKAASTPVEEARKAAEIYLDNIVDTMERRALAMVWTDMMNLDELDQGTIQRIHRARVASELGRQYVRQRDVLINLFDPETAWSCGFERNVETEPPRLILQVRRAVHGLKSGKVDVGKTYDGAEIDLVLFGRNLEPKLEELEKLVMGINDEVREAEGTIAAKNRAIQAHDEAFVPGARSLEAAFLLAGMPELAKKVKPSERRPGRRAEEAEAEREGREAPGLEELGIEEPSMPTIENPVVES